MILGLLVLGATVLVSSSFTYNYRYVQGPLNTASCADPNTVLTEDECQSAAKYFGFGDVKSEHFDGMPSGCVSKGDNIFYNANDEGNANENCSPICLEKPAEYVMGLVNTVCPEFSSILSQAQCSQAARELELPPQVQVMETPDYPRCYYGKGSQVYFNEKGPTSNEHASPICLRVPGPDPCEGVSCPDSETCENGICADPCSRCGEKEQCIDGECVDLPCKGRCGDWEHCKDDECIDTKCQDVKCKDNGYEYCLQGTCYDRCNQGCEDIEFGPEDLQVCGSNGVTYDNACYFDEAQCRDEKLTAMNEGPCPDPCNECKEDEYCENGKCYKEQETTCTDGDCNWMCDKNKCKDDSDCCQPDDQNSTSSCVQGFCDWRPVEHTEESTEKSYVECLATLLDGLYLQISSYLDGLLQDM